MTDLTLYKVCVFIPEEHLSQVKAAMFAAGAGRIGDYDSCCWQVKGEGQFRPLSGSKPFIGELDQVETVVEYKVEMVCNSATVKATIRAMREAHPYEEPAFDVYPLVSF